LAELMAVLFSQRNFERWFHRQLANRALVQAVFSKRFELDRPKTASLATID
jgi:hypothetical protein